jgi:hypothetical protein
MVLQSPKISWSGRPLWVFVFALTPIALLIFSVALKVFDRGSSLSPAEWAERKIKAEDEAYRIREDYALKHALDEYAALYTDGQGDDPDRPIVVGFTGHLRRHRRAISKVFPYMDLVRVVRMRNSYRKLEAKENAIWRAVKQGELKTRGITLNGTGIDEELNRIVVMLRHPTKEQIDYVYARFGGPTILKITEGYMANDMKTEPLENAAP